MSIAQCKSETTRSADLEMQESVTAELCEVSVCAGRWLAAGCVGSGLAAGCAELRELPQATGGVALKNTELVNILMKRINLDYTLKTQFVPRSKHTPSLL